MPELQRTLDALRAREPRPDDHFPKKLNRVMLNDAAAGSGHWSGILCVVAKEALYERIRRKDKAPLFGTAATVSERLSFDILRLYERIAPRLKMEGVPPMDALRLVISDVFIPTAFLILVENWRGGLGTEFQGSKSWYLPKGKDGPVKRVMQHWLKSAGFRNAHDLKKELNTDSARRSADRWLKGDFVPTIDELHRLTKKFSTNVGWLGEGDNWISRFTLVCGLAHAYSSLDELTCDAGPCCSNTIGQVLDAIEAEGVAVDDDRILMKSETFFAARLIQRRLRRNGSWETEVMSRVKESLREKCPPNASDEDLASFRKRMEWGIKPGNWLMKLIMREIEAGKPGIQSAERSTLLGLEESVLELGIAELNSLLAERRGQRAGAR